MSSRDFRKLLTLFQRYQRWPSTDHRWFQYKLGLLRNAETKQLDAFLDLQSQARCPRKNTDMVISYILTSPVMMTIWLRVCRCLPCWLIISLLTLMYIYRNNLFQQKQIHIENISRLTKKLFLLICEFAFLYWIHLDNVEHLIDLYYSTLRYILDEHDPLMTKEIQWRPMFPWCNTNLHAT